MVFPCTETLAATLSWKLHTGTQKKAGIGRARHCFVGSRDVAQSRGTSSFANFLRVNEPFP